VNGQWDDRSTFVFQSLFLWREREAEQRDECPAYICPTALLLDAAEYLPTSLSALLKIQSPLPASMRTTSDPHLDGLDQPSVDSV
jgi:ribonuclease D